MTPDHEWEYTARYERGHTAECSRCGVERFFKWQPGWPGVFTYSKGGALLVSCPPCTPAPEIEMFMLRAGDDDAWHVDEGGGKL